MSNHQYTLSPPLGVIVGVSGSERKSGRNVLPLFALVSGVIPTTQCHIFFDLETRVMGRSDSQWASRAPEELRERVSARRGWGTQRANPGPLQRKVCVCLCPGDPALSVPALGPQAFGGATSARRGSGTQGANPGPLRHNATLRLPPGDPAPSRLPLGP